MKALIGLYFVKKIKCPLENWIKRQFFSLNVWRYKNQIILLDTTVASSRLKSNLNQHRSLFGFCNMLVVTVITFYEFAQSGNKSNRAGLKNYDIYNFRTMLNWFDILVYEDQKIVNPKLIMPKHMKDFPLSSQEFEENFRDYRNEKLDNQNEKHKAIKREIELHDQDKFEAWSRIKEGSGNCRISLLDLEREELNCLMI